VFRIFSSKAPDASKPGVSIGDQPEARELSNMPRRRVVAKREILPDPKYHNQTVAKFINHVMESGKKAGAERIV